MRNTILISGKLSKETFRTGIFLFRGEIFVPADFPLPTAVERGWTYVIKANVTDNDPTRTNTGQSFAVSDVITWNGTNWTDITGLETWIQVGSTLKPIAANSLIDLRSTVGTLVSEGPTKGISAAVGLPLVDIVADIIHIESATAGETIVTANPPIAIPTGSRNLRLVGTNDTKKVTWTAGTKLMLNNGQPFSMGLGDVLDLYYSVQLSAYVEISRSDNSATPAP